MSGYFPETDSNIGGALFAPFNLPLYPNHLAGVETREKAVPRWQNAEPNPMGRRLMMV